MALIYQCPVGSVCSWLCLFTQKLFYAFLTAGTMRALNIEIRGQENRSTCLPLLALKLPPTTFLKLTPNSEAPSTPATMSKQHATLLPQTATMSNDSIVKFRPFDNVETN